jgi:hypothetical protein
MAKVQLITLCLCVLLFSILTVRADIVSINSGTDGLVINPTQEIEGFYSGEPGIPVPPIPPVIPPYQTGTGWIGGQAINLSDYSGTICNLTADNLMRNNLTWVVTYLKNNFGVTTNESDVRYIANSCVIPEKPYIAWKVWGYIIVIILIIVGCIIWKKRAYLFGLDDDEDEETKATPN